MTMAMAKMTTPAKTKTMTNIEDGNSKDNNDDSDDGDRNEGTAIIKKLIKKSPGIWLVNGFTR